MLPCWLLLHHRCLASLLPGFLCSPLLCVQPCLGAPDLMVMGLAMGKAAASPAGHRQLLKRGPAQPQGMVLGPVQAPLSLGRRGIRGTPTSQPRQSEAKRSRQGPVAEWEESCLDKGCKPSPGALHQGARSRAVCKQKSVPPAQLCGAGWA